ncbi:uncharacterized protein LOC116805087 [Drosophila grimshawi]|uniref:uncharacterized protein LOC116805087 n=1 Tax=Drosophila grimshawi TaxID=7222 RepID=UPI000C870E0D|nr:uncharacterized protein LOC116805087 [Drosophila grimshawi]
MMKSTDNVQSVEEGGVPPDALMRINIWHKILFFLLGLTCALTVCVLIRLANKLKANGQLEDVIHFEEGSIHIGRRLDN